MKVTVKRPFKKVETIKDLRNGEKFKAGTTLQLNVPRSDIRLLYVKGK